MLNKTELMVKVLKEAKNKAQIGAPSSAEDYQYICEILADTVKTIKDLTERIEWLERES